MRIRRLVWRGMALVLAVCCWPATRSAARADEPLPVRVMTFNIRCDTWIDGKDRWDNRREMAAEVIRRFRGDFVGLQEVLPNQLADLLKMLPEYRSLGRSRESDPGQGEAAPIFYRHARWQPDGRQQGTFWLSDTPQQPGSKTWGNFYPRIVTWARFVEGKTGRGLYVYNTHLDHLSQPSRQRSAAMLAKHIAGRTRPEPVLLTGDFNSGESSAVVAYLTGKTPGSPVKLIDTFRALHPDERQVRTYHGFRGGTEGEKIDFILVLPTAKVRWAEILHDSRSGRYPSDHYPVAAEVAP